jgi:hypothetical protein
MPYHFTTCGKIDDFVYSCEGEIVFRAIFVQIGEVSTHPPFSILLSDHHFISQPLGVSYFPDEAYVE